MGRTLFLLEAGAIVVLLLLVSSWTRQKIDPRSAVRPEPHPRHAAGAAIIAIVLGAAGTGRRARASVASPACMQVGWWAGGPASLEKRPPPDMLQ